MRYRALSRKYECIPHAHSAQRQEAARYLETYKAYENKSAESIQEKVGQAARTTFFSANVSPPHVQ